MNTAFDNLQLELDRQLDSKDQCLDQLEEKIQQLYDELAGADEEISKERDNAATEKEGLVSTIAQSTVDRDEAKVKLDKTTILLDDALLVRWLLWSVIATLQQKNKATADDLALTREQLEETKQSARKTQLLLEEKMGERVERVELDNQQQGQLGEGVQQSSSLLTKEAFQ